VKRRVISGLVCCVLSAVVALPVASATSDTPLSIAQSEVSSWSTAQLANEVIVVSAQATTLGSMPPAARAGYGGLLLFGATGLTHTAQLLSDLQADSPHGMLIMTDEEGGGVMRLNNLIPPIPWAQKIGSTMTPTQVQALGSQLGTELLGLGVNTDLAPVLDIDGRSVEPSAVNPDGLRSFGGSVSRVRSDGVAFMTGLQQTGVLSVVKHFPGLGYATRNTDFGPARTLPLATLQTSGLVPFEAAIASGVGAIMMSNASVPGLSPLPSSISPATINYLRSQLGFTGLIVTDSLSSGAIGALHLSVVQASVQAVAAGADLVLYGAPQSVAQTLNQAKQISSALVAAVSNGTISLLTLQNAAAQVLAARSAFPTQ